MSKSLMLRTTVLLMIALLVMGGCKTMDSKAPDEPPPEPPPEEPPPEEPPDTTCLKVQVLGCRGCEDSSGAIEGASVTATRIDDSGDVSQGVTDSTGVVCLPVKTSSRVRLDVSYGDLHGNPLEVATEDGVLDPADCNSCSLVTVTHLVDAALVNEPLSADSDTWCASNYWNGSATEFESAWLSDPTHVGFSPSGLTMTLNDRDEAGNPCEPSPGDNCYGASYASAEYKSTCFHGYGTYTATITPPAWSDTNANSGIVTGFFTYTDSVHGDGTVGENNTDGWDEVDVEILGRCGRQRHDRPRVCRHLARRAHKLFREGYRLTRGKLLPAVRHSYLQLHVEREQHRVDRHGFERRRSKPAHRNARPRFLLAYSARQGVHEFLGQFFRRRLGRAIRVSRRDAGRLHERQCALGTCLEADQLAGLRVAGCDGSCGVVLISPD
jgi:hypothetical protein